MNSYIAVIMIDKSGNECMLLHDLLMLPGSKKWTICMYHYTYTRSSGVWISISSSSIVDVVSSVDNPNSRWSNSNLYGFSSNVLPVPSSPSEYVPVSVDSPNVTSVTHIQLKPKDYRYLMLNLWYKLSSMLFLYVHFTLSFQYFRTGFAELQAIAVLPVHAHLDWIDDVDELKVKATYWVWISQLSWNWLSNSKTLTLVRAPGMRLHLFPPWYL